MPPASITTSALSTAAADAVPTDDDALAVGEDRVAGGERLAPVAGDDLAEIDDRDLHARA